MEPLASGIPVSVFDEIDSTSAEAARAYAAGLVPPRWYVAHRQIAGYGRQGRGWTSPAGNFAGTLLCRPPLPPSSWSMLSFASALAIRDALIAAGAPPEGLTLKWPNDILARDAKISGLLLERLADQTGDALAIGIGVNLAEAPDVRSYPTAALAQLKPGTAPTVLQFLQKLDAALETRIAQLTTEGFDATRQDWRGHASGIGTSVTVRLSGREETGLFEDIDSDGALILLSAGKRTRVHSGDVFFAGAESRDDSGPERARLN